MKIVWRGKSKMNRQDREHIGAYIRRELRDGTHTFTMCKCNRRGARGEMCWECWLEILERGKDFPKRISEEKKEGCGKEVHFWKKKCGQFEDLKHSNHIILCPECTDKFAKSSKGEQDE